MKRYERVFDLATGEWVDYDKVKRVRYRLISKTLGDNRVEYWSQYYEDNPLVNNWVNIRRINGANEDEIVRLFKEEMQRRRIDKIAPIVKEIDSDEV